MMVNRVVTYHHTITARLRASSSDQSTLKQLKTAFESKPKTANFAARDLKQKQPDVSANRDLLLDGST
jgi:hypothetical protein